MPHQNISLDEGMIPWRGNLSFRVYSPDKPVKYGIKACLLLCFFSGLYFPPKHYEKNIRSASGFFIAGNPFVKIPGFPLEEEAENSY
jgi:hypothetical protein